MCGQLEFYEKTYDRVTTQSEKILERTDRAFFNVTTSDDPIIRQLSSEGGSVFATDVILSHLMVCTRSVYPWDIVITKVGSKIFLDKRDGQFGNYLCSFFFLLSSFFCLLLCSLYINQYLILTLLLRLRYGYNYILFYQFHYIIRFPHSE